MIRTRWIFIRSIRFASLFFLIVILLSTVLADPPERTFPLSPQKQLAQFQLPKNLRIELVASEPQIVDPVAMAFDEFGRLYVCEMRGYPNGGVATGTPAGGRVVRLEDPDEQGRFRKSTVIAEGLRVPNSVMPYAGGVLVSDAPSILYFKNGEKKVLFTGFDLSNIQQLPNGLQWGLDNRVHSLGGNGGNLSSPSESRFKPITLRGRGFSFDPRDLTTFQPTSGGGQFGLTCDDWGNWFTATNSQHLRHIVLPDHYLARNPSVATLQTTFDIPEHGAACKVFRISPFEAWRVERTARRKDDPTLSKRLPSTELVPGGFITSACSPLIYRADLLPEAFYGNNFVCDPANNLIHRETLEPKGGTFVARRTDADKEFLASSDNWFRPCFLAVGPEGAVYIADICREVIETPLSLPKDIQDRLDLTSRGTGRIWRIVPKDAKYTKPKYPGEMNAGELVEQLESKNSWQRITAQRLLVEKQWHDAVPGLVRLAEKASFPPAKVHALWTLHALGKLTDELLIQALKDASPGVRKQALVLSEGRLKESVSLQKAAIERAQDGDAGVRFQAAFSLGELPASNTALPLATILEKDGTDPWTITAVLSSSRGGALQLLDAVLKQVDTPEQLGSRKTLIAQLVKTACRGQRSPVPQLFSLAARLNEKFSAPGAEVVLEGLAGAGIDLDAGWERFASEEKEANARLQMLFEAPLRTAKNPEAKLAERQGAIRRLRLAPSSLLLKLAPELLTPQQPPEIQLTTVQMLTNYRRSAALLLAALPSLGQQARKAALDSLLTRGDSVNRLLEAIEKGRLAPNMLDPVQMNLLREHTDAKVRERAKTLFVASASRRKVLEEYQESLKLPGDGTRGKTVFKANCVSCHRLDGEGVNLGADLQAALGNMTPEKLLVNILDPSREVDPRYVQYTLTTSDGRSLVGVLASETATSITLRQPDKPDASILRADIESLKASTKSLMPEGLEAKISRQEMADLLAYLLKR